MPIGTVKVVDVAHPLYGLTLPLIGITNKQYVGKACVVWIQPGLERIIPFTATNLAEVSPDHPPCRLSVAAIQRFLKVVASIPQLQPEDADDPHPPNTTTPAPGPARPSTADTPPLQAECVAQARLADAEPQGAGRGQDELAEGDAGGHR